jgi:hypothetical protein
VRLRLTDPKTNDSYYLAKIDVARKEPEKNAPEVELLPVLLFNDSILVSSKKSRSRPRPLASLWQSHPNPLNRDVDALDNKCRRSPLPFLRADTGERQQENR